MKLATLTLLIILATVVGILLHFGMIQAVIIILVITGIGVLLMQYQLMNDQRKELSSLTETVLAQGEAATALANYVDDEIAEVYGTIATNMGSNTYQSDDDDNEEDEGDNS